MLKKIFFSVLIFLLSATVFTTVNAKKVEGVWRLDGSASAEPRNFRMSNDNWKIESRGKEPSRAGLTELHASASGQPSESSMATIREKILKQEPDAQIFDVDLRQEPHGFANSLPVSWYVEKNRANAGKTSREIERDEVERLNSLRGVETTFEPLGNEDKNTFKPITIIPRFVSTERELCEKLGMGYQRFAPADMMFPTPEVVDDFLIFVANLPENAWLHFHCQAGHGRATLFMTMYDILKNPDVPFEDICKRQYLLGGTNLLLEPQGDDWYSKMSRDRAKKIRLFYDFVQGTRAEQIGLQWSEWLKEIKQ